MSSAARQRRWAGGAAAAIAGVLIGSLAPACRFDTTGGHDDGGAAPADAHVERPDAVAALDATVVWPDDAAPPPGCFNGVRDGTESDVDCGGPCLRCGACLHCGTGLDCASGTCSGSFCQPALTPVPTRSGTTPAFVRDDGAVLLAHYGAGHRVTGYSLSQAQLADASGGSLAPDGWAPDPCLASGHLSFDDFEPGGKTVTLACGTSYSDPAFSVSSSALFDSFADGVKGTYGAEGAPGWAMIAARGSGEGRGRTGSCGAIRASDTGGIAYCDGGGEGFANHLVSYWTTDGPSSPPIVVCDGAACIGPTCDLQVWVWLAE